MKINNKILGCLLCYIMSISCNDLDVKPINILSEEEIYGTESGVQSTFARLYSKLPIEDFSYNVDKCELFWNGDTKYHQIAGVTGEAICRDRGAARSESSCYWDAAYAEIREINMLIDGVSKYSNVHGEDKVKEWIAEARFCRAYTYLALVKRFGGVPLVDKVLDPAKDDVLLYRASEEAIFDYIAVDLDEAISGMPEFTQKGRANKYVAAAFKSRAMLTAGTLAKYNQVNFSAKDGARVCGIPSTKAKEYLKAAYDATDIVVKGGQYELYKGEWASGDLVAQANNYNNIFLKDTKENIFVVYYVDPSKKHNYDDSVQPRQTSVANNNSSLVATLDFVELFDGPFKGTNDKIENKDASGFYKLYNSPIDAFNGCEPRLRATVILPMDEFKGQKIEIRRGLYLNTGNQISQISPVDGIGKYKEDGNILKLVSKPNSNPEFECPDGTKIRVAGANGPFSDEYMSCTSGFYVRKYLDPKLVVDDGNVSTTSWIDIRYAEVLLNRAEAAFELTLEGEGTSTAGDSYLSSAFKCIKDIQERAGAKQVTGTGDITLNVIRKERKKELAFENKAYWDLVRWRTFHVEMNSRRLRCLYPFYSVNENKYFLDARYAELAGDGVYTWNQRDYYQQIPTGEITKDPNIDQNPGYN